MTLPDKQPSEVADNESMDIDDENEPIGEHTYLPHKHSNILKGTAAEELVMEESAYQFYYPLNAECSSLSFDWLVASAVTSNQYPLSMYFVAGSQAAKSYANKLSIVKVSNICSRAKNKLNSGDDESDSDSDSSSAEDDEDVDTNGQVMAKKPRLCHTSVIHNGGVNRMRSLHRNNSSQQLVATWSDTGIVYLWDLQSAITVLDSNEASQASSSSTTNEKINLPNNVSDVMSKPIFTYRGHRDRRKQNNIEGFAMDWSKCQEGWLATGDVDGGVHIWQPQNSTWEVKGPLAHGHEKSVEDIQWAPGQPQVLISCSCDSSLMVWDLRQQRPAIHIKQASLDNSDINVISWNKKNETLLLSGDDNGCIRVWDLRRVNEEFRKDPASSSNTLSKSFVHQYTYHKKAITSIEWHPVDTYTFGASSEDDQVTFWDCSIENTAVDDTENEDNGINELPPQLLFIHQGQTEVKELHWHPQHHGAVLTTALNGYNIFRMANI